MDFSIIGLKLFRVINGGIIIAHRTIAQNAHSNDHNIRRLHFGVSAIFSRPLFFYYNGLYYVLLIKK